MIFLKSYDEAMKEVRASVKASGSSFIAGMAPLPLPRREAMYALYAFCRAVDDIADDSPSDAARAEGLKLWRTRIRDLFREKKASDSITAALAPAIERFDLREENFLEIIDGMDMDASEPIVAPCLDKLDRYCDLVASAVGRVSVQIFGQPDELGQELAHHLGRALQVTNILRDLAEDAERGRLYLPRELLDKHGIETQDPSRALEHPALRAVCVDLAGIAQHHFDQADKMLEKCRPHAARPARTMRNYYHAILKKLLKNGWKEPKKRISLSLFEKLLLALRSFGN